MNCTFCKTEVAVKNGVLTSGGQRYKCKNCHKHFTIGGKRQSYTDDFKQKAIEEFCHGKISARNVAKKYGISLSTLVLWTRTHKGTCKTCSE